MTIDDREWPPGGRFGVPAVRGMHDPPAARLVPARCRGKYAVTLPQPVQWSPEKQELDGCIGYATVEYYDSRRTIRIGNAVPLELEWGPSPWAGPGVLVLTGGILAPAGWHCWMRPGRCDFPANGSLVLHLYSRGHLVIWCGQEGLFPESSSPASGPEFPSGFPNLGDARFLTGDVDGFGWTPGELTIFSHQGLVAAEPLADRRGSTAPQSRANTVECPVSPEDCRAMRWSEAVAANFWATQI